MNNSDPPAGVHPAEETHPFLSELCRLQAPVERLQERMREYQVLSASGDEDCTKELVEVVKKSRNDLVEQISGLIRDMEAYKKRKENPTRLFDLPWELRRQIYLYLLPPCFLRGYLIPINIPWETELFNRRYTTGLRVYDELMTVGRMILASKQMNEEVMGVIFGEHCFSFHIDYLKNEQIHDFRTNLLRIRKLRLQLRPVSRRRLYKQEYSELADENWLYVLPNLLRLELSARRPWIEEEPSEEFLKWFGEFLVHCDQVLLNNCELVIDDGGRHETKLVVKESLKRFYRLEYLSIDQ